MLKNCRHSHVVVISETTIGGIKKWKLFSPRRKCSILLYSLPLSLVFLFDLAFYKKSLMLRSGSFISFFSLFCMFSLLLFFFSIFHSFFVITKKMSFQLELRFTLCFTNFRFPREKMRGMFGGDMLCTDKSYLSLHPPAFSLAHRDETLQPGLVLLLSALFSEYDRVSRKYRKMR